MTVKLRVGFDGLCMLEQVFRYFDENLKDSIFETVNYDTLSHRDKLNLVHRMVFALRNGILKVEKPFFQTLIYKIAVDDDKKISKFFAKQLFDINIDAALLCSLALNNVDIAEELVEKSLSLNPGEMIHICENSADASRLVRGMAKRKIIPEVLTDYIVSKADHIAIKHMLMSCDSEISNGTFIEIIENFGSDHNIFGLVCDRVFEDTRVLNYIMSYVKEDYRIGLLDAWLDKHQGRILYYTTLKGVFSFDFIIHPDLAKRLASIVDSFYFRQGLSELVIMKSLVSGDIYSFIYAISKNSEVSYQVIKELITAEFISPYFEETLIRAGLSSDMVAASQDILKILYESCLEEMVDSSNFFNLLKKRFFAKERHFEISKNISFLISLVE